jgi:Protein of unknown function (DUF2937)
MIRRTLSMFVGGLGAVAASQAPEFSQQYAQRLGGAVNELKVVIEHFDQDAAKSGLNREDGLKRLEFANDTFLTSRGQSMRSTVQRYETLQLQQKSMDAPDVLTRVGALLKHYDPLIAKQAMGVFRPALPLTLEGGFFALLGFFGGATVGGITALPMGRRRSKAAAVRA